MEAGSYPRHRGPLYRFCILVHGINQFCQSRRDGSEVAHGHVFRHPTRRGSCIYSRTACWCGRGFTFLPVAIRCCSFDADKRGLEVKQCQRTTAFRVQVRGNHITVTFVARAFARTIQTQRRDKLCCHWVFQTSRRDLSPSGGIFSRWASRMRGPKKLGWVHKVR